VQVRQQTAGPKRRRGTAVGGVVRPAVGAGLPGLSRDAAPGAHRQRHPGVAADLQAVGNTLEELRAGARSAVCVFVRHAVAIS